MYSKNYKELIMSKISKLQMQRDRADSLLSKLDQIIRKSKRVLTLNFKDFQPITKFFNSKPGTEFNIDNSICTITENNEECIKWLGCSPSGANYPMHYHEVVEEVTMVEGFGTFYIERINGEIEEVNLKEGDTFRVERFVPHGFTNKTDKEIKYTAIHYKNK